MKENVEKKIVAFDLSFSFISRHYNFFSRSTFRQQFLDSFFVNFRETNRVTKIYENSLTVKMIPCVTQILMEILSSTCQKWIMNMLYKSGTPHYHRKSDVH